MLGAKKLRNISTNVWQPVASRNSVERSFQTQPALVKQSEPIAQPFRLIQPMRAHDHRLAFVAQSAHVIDHHLAAEHIQPARRFVEQHDRRRMNQRPGQRHALPLTRAQAASNGGRASEVKLEQLGKLTQIVREPRAAASRTNLQRTTASPAPKATGTRRRWPTPGRLATSLRPARRSCENRPLPRTRYPAARDRRSCESWSSSPPRSGPSSP